MQQKGNLGLLAAQRRSTVKRVGQQFPTPWLSYGNTVVELRQYLVSWIFPHILLAAQQITIGDLTSAGLLMLTVYH
jgi:hypothetical protein